MGVWLDISIPPVEPVTLIEIKQDLGISHTDDDVKLGRYIVSAREWVERRVQQKIALQSYTFFIDEFPAVEIKMPFIPVQEITEINYDDTDGVETIIDPIDYYLDNVSKDHWIFPVESWPVVLTAANAVRIVFLAGYPSPEEAPAPLRQAIRLKVQEFYDGEDKSRPIHDLLTNYYQFAL